MAEIIKLEQFRRGVRTPTGVYFPTVYRITGCHWRAPDDAEPDLDSLVPDPTWPHREYSLSEDASLQIANLTSVPIMRLDPAFDQGWVIVRHHTDLQSARAYMDGLRDCERDNSDFRRKLWQTTDGIFTLHSREATLGCRDCLLIYCTSQIGEDLWPTEPWVHIVASDGTVFSDPDILLVTES